MELSKRLYTVASAVTKGNRIADIGTDHGYVPIFLIKNNICPEGIAMDVNEGPLERAIEHIEKEGVSSKIGTRLSNGMEKLAVGEVDTVVIAGMGGDLICRILRAREDLLENGLELVLQPQSEWFKVRHTLHNLRYQIVEEWFLKEDGKYYVVMKAVPGVQKYEKEAEYAYGTVLAEECWPVFEEYLEKEKKKRRSIAKDMMDYIEKTKGLYGIDLEKEENTESKEQKNLCRMKQRLEEIDVEIAYIDERLRAGR